MSAPFSRRSNQNAAVDTWVPQDAQQSRKRLMPILGWLIGFFVIDAVILGIVGIVMVVR
jgi:hypothetical protein